jgi:hypothetical protein
MAPIRSRGTCDDALPVYSLEVAARREVGVELQHSSHRHERNADELACKARAWLTRRVGREHRP